MIVRSGLVLLGALLLSACTSGENSSFERLKPIIEEEIFGGPIFGDPEPAPTPREPTRAELNEVPFATIAVSIEDSPRAFVVPLADNGGYLTYQDALRRGVIMRGGLITATQGLTYNLSAVKHDIDDPIVGPRALADWPDSIYRNYQFALGGGARDFQITVACRYERGTPERVEIIELIFDTIRVVEICRNTVREFRNTYWVDPSSGFIWKSEQWIGPRQQPMTVEIIRPYAAS
ncbi:MAG: YjbF family lipoprotein [Paracoccaceae bacterium]